MSSIIRNGNEMSSRAFLAGLRNVDANVSDASTLGERSKGKGRAKNWCVTINNPDITDRLRLNALVPQYAHYVVYQYEKGNNGTKHIQGFVQLKKQLRMVAVKELISQRAHLEIMRSKDPKKAAEYCKKDDTRLESDNAGPFEFGEIVVRAPGGTRSDISEFVEDALSRDLSEAELIENYGTIVARYPRFVERVQRLRIERQVEIAPLIPDRPWQLNLVEWLRMVPDKRKVIWYVDLVGNTGKSHFCRHYHERPKMIITGGKHADIYFAYSRQPVVFFDFARSKEEAVPWEVIENFKNGYFFSSKYESRFVAFDTPHVVCFSNFYPDLCKLSADRWEIVNITKD